MFYQLLRVQHSCSSTQSWGSVLPSIVETRYQNSQGCPLFFSGIFLCIGDKNPIHPQPCEEVVDHSRSKMHGTSLIITHDPGMRPGPEGVGRGRGLQNGRGACEVLPLQKEGAEKVLAMLKGGGAQQVLG